MGIGLLCAARAGAFGVTVGEDYLAAAGELQLGQVVPGDALLAGGRIDSDAAIGGDATVAGAQVTLRATVGEDLYAAGGQVEIDAFIGGDARVAGGRVTLAPETRIEGDVAVAGGTVAALGSIGRYLSVAGGDVEIGGEIGGDVSVYARRLTVLPGTRIAGTLHYRTAEAPQVAPDVFIGGGVFEAPVEGETDGVERERPAWDAGEAAGNAGWVWWLGLFVLGALLVLGTARFSVATSRALAGRPWLGMGVGALVLVCMPAIIVALVLTLIGIPVALLLLLVYLAMLLAAYVIGALYLGDRLLVRWRPGSAPGRLLRLGVFVLVLLALAMLGGVPWIGDLVRFAVLLLGLGAIALVLWGGALERSAPPAPRPPA
jgi:hypothetical protein